MICGMSDFLEDIKNQINESELIVVGLGEEWNVSPKVIQSEVFKRISADLNTHPEYGWLWPYFYYKLTDDTLRSAYENLFRLLDGKNYFVVSTATNRSFTPYVREGRLVMPCGSEAFLCDDSLTESVLEETFIKSLDAYLAGDITLKDICFVKDKAGEIVPFNNVYTVCYKEEGYLPQWTKYMSWVQGTMNRKTCLLELGVGLYFPSVIRFPFEKMTYFNNKAFCFRVHKSLYQLAEEMASKSKSIPVHSVELFAGNSQE